MQVGRRVLDPAQRERLDRPVARLLREALELQVVHQLVEVVGCWVAGAALALAEEDLLATALALGRP